MSQLFASGDQSIGVSASTCPSNEHPGLISFRMDWLDLLAAQGTLKSLLQHRRAGNRNRELQHVFPAAQLEAPGPGLEIQPAPGPCSQLAAVSLRV